MEIDLENTSRRGPRVTGFVLSRDPPFSRVVLSDGTFVEGPRSEWLDLETHLDLVAVTFNPVSLVFRAKGADWIWPEVPHPDDLAPIHGRPVVYLDQNHWSTLSKALYDPDRVREPELAAAHQVIAWAQERKVILPLSSAHFSETAAWTHEESRYRLALTMIRLSRGWQFRDPLAVRRDELRFAVMSFNEVDAFVPRAVVTLEPWALHDDVRKEPGPVFDHANASADFKFLFQVVLSTNVNVAMALNSEPIPPDPPGSWTSAQQQFTEWLAGERHRSARSRRSAAEAWAFRDTGTEIAKAAAEAGVSTEQMGRWVESTWLVGELSPMPAVQLYREVFVDKHLEPATRWEDNDLTDLLYLATAAGYSDYVIAERRAAALLLQAKRRLGLSFGLSRTLADGVVNLGRILGSGETGDP